MISKLLVLNGFFHALLPVGATHMIDNAMSRTTHVVRRGATYHFRLRVPTDLVEHYGKREIIFSLRTKDKSEAVRKSHEEALRHLDEFERIRKTLKAHTTDAMSPEEIRAAALRFAHDLLLEDETERRSGRVSEGHRTAMEVLEDHARPTLAGDWEYDDGACRRMLTTITRNHLEEQGIKVIPESDLESHLIYAFTEAAVESIDAIKERDRGRIVITPERPVAASSSRSTTPHRSNGARLSTIIEQYSQEQEMAGNWQGKTGPENRAIYRTLIEITGDPLMSDLGYPQMVTFKESLQRLPANINKDQRYRGRAISEILAMPELKPMSTTTVNKYLTRASSLLKWSQRHGYIEKNYAEGLSITQRGRKASTDRDMFEADHLKVIFKAISEGRVTVSGRVASFHYWAPLLGYLTGARVNEIASLRLCDFGKEGDIHFISIVQQNDGEKTTKTQAGVRDIPIHPELIRLGLLDYIGTLKNLHQKQGQGQARLFPELKLTKNGYGSKITSWFSGHTSKQDSFLWRDASIREGNLSFHSFRHTMATLLERHGIDKILTKRILGHSLSDDVTYGRYSKGADLEQLKVAILTSIPTDILKELPEYSLWLKQTIKPKEIT